MHQTALRNYIRHCFFNCLEDAFVPVGSDTFDLNAEPDQVIQVLFDLLIMLSIGETNQLCITVLMILIANQAELLEVCCIHAQVNFLSLENVHCRRTFQKVVKSSLQRVDGKPAVTTYCFKSLPFKNPF